MPPMDWQFFSLTCIIAAVLPITPENIRLVRELQDEDNQ